jgi:hypothetical protein
MIAAEIKIIGNFDLGGDIDKLQQSFAEQIPVEAARIIDESQPKGRIYRRGAATGQFTKRGERAGLKRRGKTRQEIASRFHRASAPGQAPASDTGRLKRDIKVQRTGRGIYRIVFGAPYAGILEFKMDRPFALPAIEAAAKKVFNQ